MGQKLHIRLETWKKLLLDFGKRNRLINFKDSKRSNVHITAPAYDDVFDRIAVQEDSIVFPYFKKFHIDEQGNEICDAEIKGDVETNKTVLELQKTLKNLRYRAITSIEEQGTNVLFLTFGMLKWRESDDSDVTFSSPIILVPVKLSIESITSPYILTPHEDEIVVNPTLQYKLEHDHSIKFPEFDSTQDLITDYFEKCEKIIQDKGWTIERSVNLSYLSFLKINMYKDLERNEDRLCSNPIVSAIAGETDPISLDIDFDNYDHDKNERPIDVFQVVDADSSQQDAILLSKKGVSFVLQGPPGTGKSQTITNIISEALADGKKVLFVSEKMAALQVVYNRLDSVGLSKFCLTLHSHKANKKAVLQELASSISIDRKRVTMEALSQLETLQKKREELNEYQDELHTPCSGLNTTVFDINGRLAKIDYVPDIIFPIPDIEKTTGNDLANKTYLLEELKNTIGKQSTDYKDNVWRGATVDYLSNQLRHDIDSNIAQITPQLSLLDKQFSSCDNSLETNITHTIDGLDLLLEFLQIAQNSPLFPERWIDDDLSLIFKKLDDCKETTEFINLSYEKLLNYYNQEVFDIDSKSIKTKLEESKDKAFSVFSLVDDSFSIDDISLSRQQLNDASSAIDSVFTKAAELAQLLGLNAPENLTELELFVKKLNVLVRSSSIKPSPNWFNREKFNQLKNSLSSRKKAHDDYTSKLQSILDVYDKDILTIEYYPILQRFRGEYNSFFRFLKKQYKKDINLSRGYSKSGTKLGYKDALNTLIKLKDFNDSQNNVQGLSDQCRTDYGSYYQGVDTNWNALQTNIESFDVLCATVNKFTDKLQDLLINVSLPTDEIKQFLNLSDSVKPRDSYDVASKLLIENIKYNSSYKNVLKTITDGLDKSKDLVDTMGELLSHRKTSATYVSLLQELDDLVLRHQAINSIDQQKQDLVSMFGSYYDGIETNWNKTNQALSFAKDFKEFIGSHSIPRVCINKICSDANSVSFCKAVLKEISSIKNKIDEPLKWFFGLFEDDSRFRRMNLLDLSDCLLSCKNNKNLLEEWVDYCSNLKKCNAAGLQPYVEQLEKNNIKTDDIVNAYLKRFYRLWLDKMMEEHFPAIKSFRGRIHERNIHDFCTLDEDQFKIAQARVREKLISNIPSFDSFTTAKGEIGILKRELNKQRRIMPLRKLFMAIPNLISTLRPCFMMSPLSVSVFLEAQSYEFDMVIFDEASQVHTEDAIGAIMRGKQVIIVGDTKQLPPTNFFATSLNDEDYDVDYVDEDKYDDAGAYESILEEAVTVLPERSLRWHYRSRDEHLIAFSNIKIYNGSLVTFPSSIEKEPDLGVEYIHVSNGVYDRSGKRNNVIEAKRVAELVFEHFRKHPERSLGVVTFSEAQQNAVDAAIRQLRLSNSSMERFFTEESEEPFFIKNLENVQGDERDTIIFSIGYAKDSNGIMYMNFGPLSREGGYRRLNVAITRAKYNVKLVGSIVATDINLDKASAEGVRLLRSYIEYAQQGVVALNKELLYTNDAQFDSPFEESVYDFLVLRGYDVVTQVGCSGFRIDLAIKHPHQTGKFVLGIECDGAMYHSSRTARERDRLRQTVLEDMGWTIYRIWSTDWIKNPKSEEDKLVEAIDMAISGIQLKEPMDSFVTQLDDNGIEDTIFEVTLEPAMLENEGYGFDTYESVSLNDYLLDQTQDKFRKIIEHQQPIHFELLCRILAPLWGNQKATNVIRKNVNYYLKYLFGDNIVRKNDFISFKDFDNLKVRVPATPDDVRPIEYISEDELSLAMKTIVEKNIGITPDELFTEVARAYGFKRTGDKISKTLITVYINMLNKKVLKEIDGKVNAVNHNS